MTKEAEMWRDELMNWICKYECMEITLANPVMTMDLDLDINIDMTGDKQAGESHIGSLKR